ncbi:hypothetical protein GGTG_03968 [Gaeumannomyces tritici R3-111a-1]|uniref:Uncharacterized protein n=1 Tax=Gaeumannomyces tritici (strain R3-111a-1) TaxID=644352 RepID=J3NRR8_GAET3|nr:hypothetical protein GGTG_03968 [Gaeumannomyces tritici R3-111a-1]EJT78874.1 hypothetical protein GGTG_03968 [Gaeumannomyces tritici R3-111a-1]
MTQHRPVGAICWQWGPAVYAADYGGRRRAGVLGSAGADVGCATRWLGNSLGELLRLVHGNEAGKWKAADKCTSWTSSTLLFMYRRCLLYGHRPMLPNFLVATVSHRHTNSGAIDSIR